jgi:hypothetical protein
MNAWTRRSIWFGRLVLGAAALLLTRIGAGFIVDPVGQAAPHGMVLNAPEAVTSMRVEGGVFVGIAVALAVCAASERRLLAGLAFFATVATAITAVRLLGLAVDGAAPFTLHVLAPEMVLVVLSTTALFLERRRTRAGGATTAPRVASDLPVRNPG